MALDQTSRQQEQPPVAPDYANQAAMIAAQASQVAGWLYHDGTKLWQYLGTTAGTIADYREVGAYQSATLRASNTALFDKDYIIGNAGARSGNILFDFTGAQLGAVTFMKHNNSGAYTFPSEGEVRDFEIAKLALVTGDVWFAFTMIDNTASSEVVFIQLSLTEAQVLEYNA